MITVVLSKVGLGETGLLFEATLNGEVIVRSHFAPEYPAARVLQSRGLTGPFRTSDATGRTRMEFASIDETAKWQVVEDDKGIRLERWVALPPERRAILRAGSTGARLKDALKRSEGTDVAPEEIKTI